MSDTTGGMGPGGRPEEDPQDHAGHDYRDHDHDHGDHDHDHGDHDPDPDDAQDDPANAGPGTPVAASDPGAWGVPLQAGQPQPPAVASDPTVVADPAAAPVGAAPVARGGTAWKSWALRIGVIGAFVIGALVLRDRLTGSAADLRIGDCFDVPTAQGEVSEVQHQPCHEPHDAEVLFVGDHPAGTDTYPGESAFDDFVVETCIPAFDTYVGRSYATDTELELGYFYPTRVGWPEDREVTCYVVRIDGAKLSSSVKGGG